MKRCPKCDTQKDESSFYNNRSTSDGKDTYCKPCKKAAVAAYQKTDKGKATQRRSHIKCLESPNGRADRNKRVRKWEKTEIGKAKKQEYKKNWLKTDNGRACKNRLHLKRYYRDPAYFSLKATARRNGCEVGLLKQVRERDKVCRLCGTDQDLQFDHVFPVSLGGKGTLENLQLLCGVCNRFKSNNLFLPGGGMLVTATVTFE